MLNPAFDFETYVAKIETRHLQSWYAWELKRAGIARRDAIRFPQERQAQILCSRNSLGRAATCRQEIERRLAA